MMTFIIIATLMVVTAVAVTVCVMQNKAIVLINQNKNLLVQLSEEKAKATKVLSEKEQELREAKDRASRHLSDWNALYLEKKAAEAKKAAAAEKKTAAKATVKKTKTTK
jgi:peptidoglycan hydrolase CwlO-like protein